MDLLVDSKIVIFYSPPIFTAAPSLLRMIVGISERGLMDRKLEIWRYQA